MVDRVHTSPIPTAMQHSRGIGPWQAIIGKLQLGNTNDQVGWQVVTAVKEDLGKHPEELFAQFERTPLASASLAQVCGLRHAPCSESALCHRPL